MRQDNSDMKNFSATASTAGSSDSDSDNNEITQIAKKVLQPEQKQKVMTSDMKQVILKQQQQIQHLRALISKKKNVYQSVDQLSSHKLRDALSPVFAQAGITGIGKQTMMINTVYINALKTKLDCDERQ